MDSRNIFMAMTSSDPAERQRYMDREMLRTAVSYTISCPYCRQILDVRSAVNFEIYKNGTQISDRTLCGDCGAKAIVNLPKVVADIERANPGVQITYKTISGKEVY